ncbi:PucR family transcriptional regulator [Nocardioides rubriscoriae]|uniref:PucR family transcriptional regulator n=1 Tax=Nocardioides rubriscoriae TaxID=642762 RepID=UPI0011DF90F1|nr:helix-turn-helix domain-containing protein [Nocardioides rubriscoriae]
MPRLDRVAAGAARDAGRIDPALLGDFLPIVVDAAASGRRLRRAELRACEERGSAAALAGVPLRALVDLYLSACWRLWEELDLVDGSAVASADASQVRAAGLAVLRAADDAVAALAEGFQLARNDLSRHQESMRREVFDLLLAGGPPAVGVTGRAADLGLDLTSPHAVLVARHERTFDHPSLTSVPRRLESALGGRHGDAYPLVAVKDGALVCVFAAPDQASVGLVGERLSTVLADVDPGAAAAPDRRTWQAAVGRTLPGAGSVRVSYEQAVSALALARRLGLDSALVDSGDLVVYEVLLRDRAAIDELIATVLTPLRQARGGARPLLETLEAYYASGGVATATAARLHLSVRAVTYRLQRIGDLLGMDPTDPAHRFTLHAAVLGARLLDWS